MSYLIAIVFDNEEEAAQVRDTLRMGQNKDLITLEDSAVIVRDADGEIKIKNEVDRGVKTGALWGSLIGLLVGGFLFPFFGLAMGALGGAAIGKWVSDGLDPKFIKDVGEKLSPGSSAIFYIFRQGNVDAAVAALRPYKGEILTTTLSPDAEKALSEELKSRIK